MNRRKQLSHKSLQLEYMAETARFATQDQSNWRESVGMETFIVVAVLVLIPAGIFALHRFGLYLEHRGLLHYWHSKPGGGAGYNPFQEMIQPQMRHIVQVEEQQLRDEGEGAPPGGKAERWRDRETEGRRE